MNDEVVSETVFKDTFVLSVCFRTWLQKKDQVQQRSS